MGTAIDQMPALGDHATVHACRAAVARDVPENGFHLADSDARFTVGTGSTANRRSESGAQAT